MLTLSAPLNDLTPCQNTWGRWYKRDDTLKFSNGVNGKVRTSMWLANYAKTTGFSGLVYGGSVLAPALGRVASAAAIHDMDCYLIVGSKTAIRHDTVRVAVEAGAQLIVNPVAYNPALQARAKAIAEESDGMFYQIPYGVSTPATWDDTMLKKFLDVDAPQVDNLPHDIETLVIPFGSGNTACAILYALATRQHPSSLKRVALAAVGPDRLKWLEDRLERVGVTCPFKLELLPIHPDFATYSDQMPAHEDGIDFHPTYEGKVIRYLNAWPPSWWKRDGKTCFWIVGGPL